MPNHVENHLTFDCSEERLKEILKAIGRDEDSALDGQYGIRLLHEVAVDVNTDSLLVFRICHFYLQIPDDTNHRLLSFSLHRGRFYPVKWYKRILFDTNASITVYKSHALWVRSHLFKAREISRKLADPVGSAVRCDMQGDTIDPLL